MVLEYQSLSPRDRIRRRTEDEQRRQALAPRELPRDLREPTGMFQRKESPYERLARTKRASRWMTGEQERVSGIERGLQERQTRMQEAGIRERGATGRAQMQAGLERERQEVAGRQALELERERGRQGLAEAALRGALAPRKSGVKAPTSKEMFDIREGLFKQWTDKKIGKDLRRKYGDDGFELFLKKEMEKYSPAQPVGQQTAALQPSVSATGPADQLIQLPDGTWTNRKALEQPFSALQPARSAPALDVESYAQGLAGTRSPAGRTAQPPALQPRATVQPEGPATGYTPPAAEIPEGGLFPVSPFEGRAIGTMSGLPPYLPDPAQRRRADLKRKVVGAAGAVGRGAKSFFTYPSYGDELTGRKIPMRTEY